MSQESSEPADARLSEKLYNFRVRDKNDKEVGRDAKVRQADADRLTFTLEFREPPASHIVRVSVVIHKSGADNSGTSGAYKSAPLATTFVHFVEVVGAPPRLEFPILHHEHAELGERWHDGPGPYDTTIALTPMNANGEPDEGSTSALRYGLTLE
jgi:hypothetical protein